MQFLVFMYKTGRFYNGESVFRDVPLTLSDGETVSLSWLGAFPSTCSAESKKVVLLLHGILGHSVDFTDLAKRFYNAGYIVVGFNRRGHGRQLTKPR